MIKCKRNFYYYFRHDVCRSHSCLTLNSVKMKKIAVVKIKLVENESKRDKYGIKESEEISKTFFFLFTFCSSCFLWSCKNHSFYPIDLKIHKNIITSGYFQFSLLKNLKIVHSGQLKIELSASIQRKNLEKTFKVLGKISILHHLLYNRHVIS